MLDRAEEAIDCGDWDAGLEICQELLRTEPSDADGLALRAEVRAALGDLLGALDDAEHAHALVPDWLDGEVRRAALLIELAELEQAATLLDERLALQPGRADAVYLRAIVHELLGEEATADALYLQAARHPDYFAPCRVGEDRFVALAQEALDAFPERIRAWFDNVDIRAPDLPLPEHVLEGDSPLGMLVLGFFDGTPRSFRSTEDPFGEMPGHVFLFRKNLERMCRSQDELREQIDITLRHELGHFLGLDEDDMERLGIE